MRWATYVLPCQGIALRATFIPILTTETPFWKLGIKKKESVILVLSRHKPWENPTEDSRTTTIHKVWGPVGYCGSPLPSKVDLHAAVTKRSEECDDPSFPLARNTRPQLPITQADTNIVETLHDFINVQPLFRVLLAHVTDEMSHELKPFLRIWVFVTLKKRVSIFDIA